MGSFYHSNNSLVLFGHHDVTPLFREASVDEAGADIENTTLADQATSYQPDPYGEGEMRLTGYYRQTEAQPIDTLFKSALAVPVPVLQALDGRTIGKPAYMIFGYVRDKRIPTSLKALMGLEARVRAEGGPRLGTILQAPVALVAAGQTASYDRTASYTGRWRVQFHMIDFQADPGTVLALTTYHSANNSAFSALASSNFNNEGSAMVEGTGTVNRYLAAGLSVVSGTLISATYVAAFAAE